MRHLRGIAPLLAIGISITGACEGDDSVGPVEEEFPNPGPGPHLAISPIPLSKLARVTPLGSNNKTLPIGHTYWRTCDETFLMPTDRPCVREHLPIRAPGDGVIFSIDAAADGGLTIEGPPGLLASFAHVTPALGLSRGDSVRAGDTVATMFYDHGFDFAVVDFGREPHVFVRPERAPIVYLHAESPVAQFPEPLRAELVARVQTMEDPLGRLSYDVAETAAGAWFREGTPVEEAHAVDHFPDHLFLGRLQERDETRIMIVGEGWSSPPRRRMVVIDPSEPSWDELTASSGVVALRGWFLTRDGGADLARPQGTVVLEVLGGQRLRIEWFDTHDPVHGFTGSARIYER